MIKKIKLKFTNLVNSTVEYQLKMQQLQYNSLFSKESGVNPNSNIIVSLTTFGKYLNTAHIAIESLLEQSLQPKKIVLWISNKICDSDIPEVLKRQQKRGLVIRKTNDIRAYTKLIPALKEYPDNVIITFDDDNIYPFDSIECLYKGYLKDNSMVYFRFGHRMILKSSNSFIPYNDFQDEIFDENINILNLPLGVGGVLYSPHIFGEEIFNEDVFLKICPYADDIWYKAMEVKYNIQSQKVIFDHKNYIDTDFMLQKQNGRLNSINVSKNKNDTQIKAVWDYYNLWEKYKN